MQSECADHSSPGDIGGDLVDERDDHRCSDEHADARRSFSARDAAENGL